MRDALKSLESRAFALMRWVLSRRARDLTDELTGRSCLVIAPHPDDETLGCGSTILRATGRGCDVRVVVVADGRHSQQSRTLTPEQLGEIRRREVLEACRLLGVPADRVYWLACEDRHVDRDSAAARDGLKKVIAEFKPAQILSPSGIDRHGDHRVLSALVHALVVDGTIRCPVFEYPIWFFNARTWMPDGPATLGSILRLLWSPSIAAFTLKPVLVQTEGTLDRKRRAVEAFASQMTNLTGEPGWPTLSEKFLAHFFGPHEIFFVPRARGEPGRG